MSILTTLFVGIDVSKQSNYIRALDFNQNQFLNFKTLNNEVGATSIKDKVIPILTQNNFDSVVFIIESTGVYSYHIATFLSSNDELLKYNSIVYCVNPKVVKKYGMAHISIKPCRIIGTHRLFVFLYITPKYKPIPIVVITLNRITSGSMPIKPGICSNPKTIDDYPYGNKRMMLTFVSKSVNNVKEQPSDIQLLNNRNTNIVQNAFYQDFPYTRLIIKRRKSNDKRNAGKHTCCDARKSIIFQSLCQPGFVKSKRPIIFSE